VRETRVRTVRRRTDSWTQSHYVESEADPAMPTASSRHVVAEQGHPPQNGRKRQRAQETR